LWGTKMKLEQEQDDGVGVCVFLTEVMRSTGSEQGNTDVPQLRQDLWGYIIFPIR
jgi:hypothetical protein